MSLFPDLPAPESNCDIARRIFAHWQTVTNHPKSHMDAKRQNLITARLVDGYSEADLKLAATGISVSAWHQGQNPDRKVYDSVELCYRNADKVDMLMREGENYHARIARQAKQRAESMTVNTETGDTYRANRASLLRIVGK